MSSTRTVILQISTDFEKEMILLPKKKQVTANSHDTVFTAMSPLCTRAYLTIYLYLPIPIHTYL